MYLCYLDESGTPEIPGTSSHFVLCGLAIPVWKWRVCEKRIAQIMSSYGLAGAEFHTAWIVRSYEEQFGIEGFEAMSYVDRRIAVGKARVTHLLKSQKEASQSKAKHKAFKQREKNYRESEPYVHLTYNERQELVKTMAAQVGRWKFSRLFAECIDKAHFEPSKSDRTISEQALEQVVARFQLFLKSQNQNSRDNLYGMLIHDNNETVARKHIELIKSFHRSGTAWTSMDFIIERRIFSTS